MNSTIDNQGMTRLVQLLGQKSDFISVPLITKEQLSTLQMQDTD